MWEIRVLILVAMLTSACSLSTVNWQSVGADSSRCNCILATAGPVTSMRQSWQLNATFNFDIVTTPVYSSEFDTNLAFVLSGSTDMQSSVLQSFDLSGAVTRVLWLDGAPPIRGGIHATPAMAEVFVVTFPFIFIYDVMNEAISKTIDLRPSLPGSYAQWQIRDTILSWKRQQLLVLTNGVGTPNRLPLLLMAYNLTDFSVQFISELFGSFSPPYYNASMAELDDIVVISATLGTFMLSAIDGALIAQYSAGPPGSLAISSELGLIYGYGSYSFSTSLYALKPGSTSPLWRSVQESVIVPIGALAGTCESVGKKLNLY
eukprot:TRINITY_DN3243_c0_g1_i1.p1 TRINITY_DN3243_c0_g1~~TRINITY_DN3243_c0_g1_i1.p1  ORF type:complete len:318 (+),score=53.30 TRINITY_DN3243_c0_g1_i1:102-1055(+)